MLHTLGYAILRGTSKASASFIGCCVLKTIAFAAVVLLMHYKEH
jgi:hypothetical protein